MSNNYKNRISKKTGFLWSMLLVFMSLSIGAFSQGTIQIGGGAGTASNFPINSCYGYNYSQQIYLASEFSNAGGVAGDISTLRFFYTTGSDEPETWNNDWNVYIGHTTKSSFTSATDWEPISNLTLVYNGAVTVATNSWVEISFIAPFDYDGTSNLLVAIDENTPDFSCTANWSSYTAPSNQGLLYRSDGTNPDPTMPPTASIGPINVLAQIQFVAALADCLPPTGVVVTPTSLTELSASWTTSDALSYNYELRTSGGPESGIDGLVYGGNTLETNLSFESLSESTPYQFYVQSVCESSTSNWAGPFNVIILNGDVCATAIDLTTLVSPFNGTTAGATSNYSGPCNLGNASPDLIYYIEVLPNAVLSIGQTVNGYDSEIYLGYGGACPGTTQIACFDDPDVQNIVWTNNTGVSQTVYWVQDGYFNETNFGTFTLEWTLTPPPACLLPASLTATVTSLTTATLAWEAPVPDNLSGYEFFYSTSNTEPVGSGTFTEETSVMIIDIIPGTTYYAFVRSDCGDGVYSEWVGPVSFASIPGNICETALDLSALTSPYSGTTVGATDDYSIDCSGGNTSPDLFFFIEVPANGTLSIGQTVNGYDSEIYVGYGGACPGTTAIACFDDPDVQVIDWTNNTGASQTVYWVQDGYNVITQTGTFTLSWTLTPPPACVPPSALTANTTSLTTADLSWTAPNPADVTGYEYFYSTLNTQPAGAGTFTIATSVQDLEIIPGTTYYAFVRSDCGDGNFSDWVGPVSFVSIVGNSCGTAIELETLISPYNGTTEGATDDFSGPCNAGNTSPDLFYSIEVPDGYTLEIGQTVNGYDSEIYVGYSGACPGETQIACFDDPDVQEVVWINETGVSQTVYWVQDGYLGAGNFGTFTLAWNLIAPPAVCLIPENVTATVTDVAAQEVTISWDAPAEIPAEGYQYIVSTSNTTPIIDGITTTATSIVIGNNAYNTIYYVFVRSNCGDGLFSDWTESTSFMIEPTTGCTDTQACNYDEAAIEDDGSCTYEETFYLDADGDGFGDLNQTSETCEPLEGYVANSTDCNDNDNSIWQSADLYIDIDGDGYDNGSMNVCYGAEAPIGYSLTTLGSDCNDDDNTSWQSSMLYVDTDNDGYDAGQEDVCYGVEIPEGYSMATLGDDCNDDDNLVWQSSELYLDSDSDGYTVGIETVCYGAEIPAGYTIEDLGFDCNDNDDSVWQSATLFVDLDGDGYDNGNMDICYGVEIPEGYAVNSLGTDCDDSDITQWDVTVLNVTLDLGINDPLCSNFSETAALTGGLPIGGIWSGTGVEGNSFLSEGLVEGTYTITYTVEGDDLCVIGGSATDEIEVEICTGINELPSNVISLYPNVTTGLINIRSDVKLTEATIMDSFGKMINTISINNTGTEFFMDNSAPGVYYIKVSSTNGQQTFRVVKVD